MMLCNQSLDVLAAAAARLSLTDDLRANPLAAAAEIAEIESIYVGSQAAFDVCPEEEPGQPGHVSIRFAACAQALPEPDQRNLRDALIRKFGEVRPVSEIWASRC